MLIIKSLTLYSVRQIPEFIQFLFSCKVREFNIYVITDLNWYLIAVSFDQLNW